MLARMKSSLLVTQRDGYWPPRKFPIVDLIGDDGVNAKQQIARRPTNTLGNLIIHATLPTDPTG